MAKIKYKLTNKPKEIFNFISNQRIAHKSITFFFPLVRFIRIIEMDKRILARIKETWFLCTLGRNYIASK